MHFDGSWKKVRPGTLGRQKSRLTGLPQKSLSKNMEFAVAPLVLTPFVPSRAPQAVLDHRVAQLQVAHPLAGAALVQDVGAQGHVLLQMTK